MWDSSIAAPLLLKMLYKDLFEKLCPRIWKSNIPCGDIKENPVLLFYPEFCYGYGIGGSPELSEAIRHEESIFLGSYAPMRQSVIVMCFFQ